MDKSYISEYLNIINEFNSDDAKWINYGTYKNVKLYFSRTHIIDQKSYRYDIYIVH